MNLLEKVKSAINEMDLPFIYFDFVRANNELDITEVPCVIGIRNPISQLPNIAGMYCEQTDFLLFFVENISFDRTSFENEEIISRMKKLALTFVRNVRKGNDLIIIRSGRGQKIYDYMDLNVTGWGLDITLRESIGNYKCWKNE